MTPRSHLVAMGLIKVHALRPSPRRGPCVPRHSNSTLDSSSCPLLSHLRSEHEVGGVQFAKAEIFEHDHARRHAAAQGVEQAEHHQAPATMTLRTSSVSRLRVVSTRS